MAALTADSLQQHHAPAREPMVLRARLSYLLMSLVVAWHSLAMVIAPAPDGSGFVQSLRLVLQPYLSLLRLDTTWNFFAPSVGRHTQFRYVIEDAAGEPHMFVPTEEANVSLAQYVWWREFKYLYEGVMESPQTRGEQVTALLCAKHASLQPAAVTLLELQEQEFWPADHLSGKNPLDDEFVMANTLSYLTCPNGPVPARRSPIRPVRRP